MEPRQMIYCVSVHLVSIVLVIHSRIMDISLQGDADSRKRAHEHLILRNQETGAYGAVRLPSVVFYTKYMLRYSRGLLQWESDPRN
jgi:hypothetical protein